MVHESGVDVVTEGRREEGREVVSGQVSGLCNLWDAIWAEVTLVLARDCVIIHMLTPVGYEYNKPLNRTGITHIH